MTGMDNGVFGVGGLRLTDTTASLQANMQKNATDTGDYNISGSPEGVVSANRASIARDRTNGNLYVKKSGTGNTGWELITTGTEIEKPTTVGWSNLGLTYASSTLSITAADQSALSATNIAYVTLPSSATKGKIVTYTMTANKSFIDDTGASQIIGALFGLESSEDWGSDIPFYIYAIGADGDAGANFAISRIPNFDVVPTNLGKAGTAAGASSQNSMFIMDSAATTGDYDGNPCLLIGSFRMTKTSGASNDWTVTALDDEDGIGVYNDKRAFDVPVGKLGAAANTHWEANGGTAPVFTNNFYKYYVKRNGVCHINYTANTNTVAGVGAVDAFLVCPFNSQDGLAPFSYSANGNLDIAGTIAFLNLHVSSSGNRLSGFYLSPSASGALQNASIASTVNISGSMQILNR